MRTIAIIIAAGAILVLGFIWYRSHYSSGKLDVDPHAAHEIEKANRK